MDAVAGAAAAKDGYKVLFGGNRPHFCRYLLPVCLPVCLCLVASSVYILGGKPLPSPSPPPTTHHQHHQHCLSGWLQWIQQQPIHIVFHTVLFALFLSGSGSIAAKRSLAANRRDWRQRHNFHSKPPFRFTFTSKSLCVSWFAAIVIVSVTPCLFPSKLPYWLIARHCFTAMCSARLGKKGRL